MFHTHYKNKSSSLEEICDGIQNELQERREESVRETLKRGKRRESLWREKCKQGWRVAKRSKQQIERIQREIISHKRERERERERHRDRDRDQGWTQYATQNKQHIIRETFTIEFMAINPFYLKNIHLVTDF